VRAWVLREFVGLASPLAPRAGAGGHPCQGVYHRPAGRRPATAFLATHYNVDFAEHYLAEYLARRGYGFLGWNTRFRGAEAYFLLDHALAEIGVGVRWLREAAGVTRVVLLGNSGGGSLMGAYQSQAVEPNVTPSGARAADAIAELPAADYYVSLAAHPGRPDVFTAWMDPSVVDESDPLSVDPALDPFDPAHGPPFGREFQRRYRDAQRARNQRITDWAVAKLAALRGTRATDLLFHTHRTWADLRMIDPSIEPSGRPPRHCYRGDPLAANYGVFAVGTQSTLRTWLSMWSLERSQCRAAPHLARITLPALVVHATADSGVYESDARAIFNALASTDRELCLVNADHYFTEPAGARDQLADLIADWVAARDG